MDLTNCPNCAAPVDLTTRSCPYCGTPYPRQQSAPTIDPPRVYIDQLQLTDQLAHQVAAGILTQNEARRRLGLREL